MYCNLRCKSVMLKSFFGYCGSNLSSEEEKDWNFFIFSSTLLNHILMSKFAKCNFNQTMVSCTINAKFHGRSTTDFSNVHPALYQDKLLSPYNCINSWVWPSITSGEGPAKSIFIIALIANYLINKDRHKPKQYLNMLYL